MVAELQNVTLNILFQILPWNSSAFWYYFSPSTECNSYVFIYFFPTDLSRHPQ